MTQAPPSSFIKIFCCYAGEDEKYLKQLKIHLSALERQGYISNWYDQKLLPGAEWKRQIHQHLNSAHIILLLVSADFIASEYCYSVEMKQTLERHERGEARVIPILLRPGDWQN